MPDRRHRPGRLSRLIVLLAGLLYLCGAVAEPLVHAYGDGEHAAQQLAVSSPGGEDAPGSSLPHVDAECLLCKASGTLPFSVRAPQPAAEVSGGRSVTLQDGPIRAPPVFPSSQPRAPPLA